MIRYRNGMIYSSENDEYYEQGERFTVEIVDDPRGITLSTDGKKKGS